MFPTQGGQQSGSAGDGTQQHPMVGSDWYVRGWTRAHRTMGMAF